MFLSFFVVIIAPYSTLLLLLLLLLLLRCDKTINQVLSITLCKIVLKKAKEIFFTKAQTIVHMFVYFFLSPFSFFTLSQQFSNISEVAVKFLHLCTQQT